jgi:hypothetical protein
LTALLTLDPGGSSGIALGTYSATEPYRRVASWQPRGGVLGFVQWWHTERPQYDEIVCEKFTVYQALKHDATQSLLIEGWLVGEGIMPAFPAPGWQEPSEMYFMAQSTDPLTLKKKKAQDWLKRYGLWATGKQYSHSDGADVNSATLHAIVALRRSNHLPTMKTYFAPRLVSA